MIELLLELLALLGPVPFLFGQTRLDELFFELGVRRSPGAEQALRKFEEGIRKSERATGAARDELGKFERRSKSTTATTGGLNRVIGRLVVLFGGLFIVRRVVGAMVRFQTTIAEVATIAGGGAEQVAELTRATLALSRSSPQSADELGAAAYQILSSGVQDTADVISILDASSRLAVAGLTDTKTAADALTTVLNAFGKDASEATEVADILFKTVELGKTRVEDLSGSIGQAATSASLAGVQFEELSAGIVAITRAGIGVQEATTSLNRLFLTLTNQTKAQEDAFKALGIEFNTAKVEADGFAGLLEEVAKITEGEIDALAELFPNIRAARAAFIIAGQGADVFNESLTDLRAATGSVDAAFEILNLTAANQAKILRNTVIATFQEIGLAVLPGVASAFASLSDKVNAFVGGIKILGADAAVVSGQIEAFVRGVVASILELVEGALEPIAFFVQRLADQIQTFADLSGALSGVVPGARQLADALGATVVILEAAADGESEFAENARAAADESERQVGFLKEARDAIAADVVIEQEFTRSLQSRTAAQAEATAARQRETQLSEEERGKRAELEAKVLDEVAQLTKTAVELQIIEFEKLEAEVERIFGDEIPEDVRAGLDKIAAELDSAKVIEAAETLGAEISERITAGLETIEIDVALSGLADEDQRRLELITRQTAFLKSQESSLRAQLMDVRLEAQQREVIRRRLAQVLGLLKEVGKEQGDIADDVAAETKARADALIAIGASIQSAAAGAADLAAEFGIVDDKLRGVIDNMLQLGTSIIGVIGEVQKLAAGVGSLAGLLAGGIGAIGAIGAIAGAIFGGPSPEALALQRTLKENNDRLQDLGRSINELRGTFDIAGADFADALRQLTLPGEEIGFIAELVQADIEAGGFREELALDLIEQFEARLRALGVDIANLDAVAEEFGITIRDEAGNIIPAAIVQLTDALQLAEGAFVGFADTLEGTFNRLRAEFEIFDIEDPLEQINRIRLGLLGIGAVDPAQVFEILGDATLSFAEKVRRLQMVLRIAGQQVAPFIQELLEIDVSTPEGRAAADRLVRDLFIALSTGEITPEELGAATFDEAVQILLDIEGLLDELGEAEEESLEEDEGQTQDIRRSVQITELQGNQLLAFLSTLVVRSEQRNILLAEIRDLLAGVDGVVARDLGDNIVPPIPDDGLTDGRFIGPPIEVEENIEIIVEVGDLVVGEGATPEQAEEIAELMIDRIDEGIGERLRERSRLLGLPESVRQRLQ